jgi:molybdopterin synthase catalytic subunit
MNVKLCMDNIDPAECREKIASILNGGECQFIGTVRGKKGCSKVRHLFFEAYKPMAINELIKIVETAKEKFAISDLLIYHRLGIVEPGGFAVVIIAAAPHRDASFAACRFAIDSLKQTVPIWKKEVMEDGEEWVSSHP